MTPHSFTIEGALGIRAGMGRDSITVDLDNLLPSDTKQVAIVGDNGSGKSTILTLGMNPWREPHGLHGSIYDQFGEAGRREVEWSHAGVRYRSILEYRNGKSRTQKATLLFGEDSGTYWLPVTLPDNTTSDGKASTYDACLRHILGPQQLYAICASRMQGAPKIAEHDDAKGLLRALLDLDYVDALADRAKLVRREVTRWRDDARAAAKGIDALPDQLTQAEHELAQQIAAGSLALKSIETAQHAEAMAKAEYEAVVAQDFERLDLVRRRAEAEQRVADAQATLASVTADAASDVNDAMNESERAVAANDQALSVIDADIAAANREKDGYQGTLDRRDEIEKAKADLDELQAQVAGKDADLAVMDESLNKLRAIERNIRGYEGLLAQRQQAADAVQQQIDDLKRRAAFVEQVPCRGEGKYAGCPALADAKSAGVMLPATERLLDEHRAEANRVHLCLGEQRFEAARFDGITQGARTALSAAISELRQQASALQTTVGLQHRIDAAAEAIARLDVRLADLAQRREQAVAEGTERIFAAERAVKQARAEQERKKAEAQAVLDAATSALYAIPVPGSGEAVDKAKAALDAAQAAVQAANEALAAAQARKATAEQRIEQIKVELERGEAVTHWVASLDDEIARWDLLAKGLQGVVDLSVEAAGPAVASIANDMLGRTFGGRFSLRVVTQRQQGNGKMAECFDISVLDSDTGEEASILHKSGGEGVWLDAALSMAVALYQQDVSGRRYEVRFSDEADDGLAADRKRTYYQMSRAALDLGGFDREYFVSHAADAGLWADAVIDVGRLAGEVTK